MKTILAEFRQGLESIYGDRLVNLVLFGSQARGDAQPDSDIDILVVLKAPVRPLLEARRISRFRGDLCLKHDVLITCVYMPEDEVRSSESMLLRNIHAEGVAIVRRQ